MGEENIREKESELIIKLLIMNLAATRALSSFMAASVANDLKDYSNVQILNRNLDMATQVLLEWLRESGVSYDADGFDFGVPK